MKNAINYFYNINVDKLRMIDNDYYFLYDGKKFVLQMIKDNFIDYEAILELNNILSMNNNSFFRIIMNKYSSAVTIISNKKYVLMLATNNYDRKFNYNDILDTNIYISLDNKLISKLNRNNWADLWKQKIDHFEAYINKNNNKYLVVNKYANYFIGLGEVAISFLENAKGKTKPSAIDRLVVCHKRIESNNLKQLYNPLNLVIDHRSRDLAEYLKMTFFEERYIDIENCIKMLNLSDYSACLLIARLLFPSFFFDLFEKILEGRVSEKCISSLIDKMDNYEEFILKIYNVFNKKNVPQIMWLKKRDYSSTLTTPSTSGTSFTNIDSIPSLSVRSIMLQ